MSQVVIALPFYYWEADRPKEERLIRTLTIVSQIRLD